MIKNLFLIALTIFSASLGAQSFTATCSFMNVSTASGKTDPGPPPLVTGLKFGNFYAATNASGPNASGRFSFPGWPVGAPDGSDNYADFTAALSPFTYYEIGLSVLPGYTLALQSIAFHVRRSSTGIRTYCVRSTRDNYNENLPATTGTNTNLGVIPDNIFFWKYDNASTTSDQRGSVVLLDTAFAQITDTVAFRFYAWNAEAGGGTFSIDNVSFYGQLRDSAVMAGTGQNRLPETVIFPNPVRDGAFTIRSDVLADFIYLEDPLGRRLKTVTGGAHEMKVHTAGLAPGLYLLGISRVGIVRRYRVVVQ